MANSIHFLHDIKLLRNTVAYQSILRSPLLADLLENNALQVVRAYQGRVGKKTGKLAASAKAQVAIGGKENDRFIGKVTIADKTVVAPTLWNGQPFYYGEFHEEGTKKKGRSRRRKYGQEGYHELREVAQEWRGGP